MPLDEISKKIIRKFQWPISEDSRFTNKPSVYKMAKEFHVHPKVIKNRINNMLESGLIRGIKFYANCRFMPWNRYFILTGSGNSFAKEVYEHFEELHFVERVIFGAIKLPNSSDTNSVASVEREFSSVSMIASDDSEMKKQLRNFEKILGHGLDLVEIMNDSPQKERLISPSEQSIL
ncbi:MAG: Lrp/AsnC family transcriptional regulator, partial [Candidatus Thermoplasmatota archaeon]|nr:Lrp/AsnC family transcriptional regulator [Candidatus Thermoplasmatota archaeon]